MTSRPGYAVDRGAATLVAAFGFSRRMNSCPGCEIVDGTEGRAPWFLNH